MTKDDKQHYWIIHLEDYDLDWNKITIRNLRDTFVNGLERDIKYISVINKKGENMYLTKGHSTSCLEDEVCLEVYDDDGNLDIIATADLITKDFLDNRAMLVMRLEKDIYDELGNDKSWIDEILEDV